MREKKQERKRGKERELKREKGARRRIASMTRKRSEKQKSGISRRQDSIDAEYEATYHLNNLAFKY